MERYNNTIQSTNGDIITSATVTVYLSSTGSPASIFLDNETTPISNPFTVSDSNYDSDGSFWFKAANGLYDIKVVNGIDTTWIYDETLFDYDDSTTIAGALTVTGAFTSLGIDDNASSTELTIASAGNIGIDTATTPASKLHIRTSDATAYNATATDAQVGIGPTLLLHNPANTNISVSQIVFRQRSTDVDSRIACTGGTVPRIATVINDVEICDIDANGINFVDNKHVYVGTSNDLDIYHDATDTRMYNNTGNFNIRCLVNSGLFQFHTYNSVGAIKSTLTMGGSTPFVKLYYDGLDTFRTVSGGFESGTFSSVGSTNGLQYDSVSQKISRNTTSAASQIVFYNPNGVVGQVQTSGTVTSYITSSDKRLKTSYGLLSNASDIINQLEIHEFHFNADDISTHHGVMAQDTYEVYPNAISKPDTDDGIWGADYSKFVPLLISNIQELNKKIQQLEAR